MEAHKQMQTHVRAASPHLIPTLGPIPGKLYRLELHPHMPSMTHGYAHLRLHVYILGLFWTAWKRTGPLSLATDVTVTVWVPATLGLRVASLQAAVRGMLMLIGSSSAQQGG